MPILQRKNQPDLYYEIDDYTDPWKNAPFILLQHGFGRSSKFWYRMVPYLARHYKVVRPDLRGLGRSSKDFDLTTGINVNAYVADFEAVIGAIGAESVHYCGESLGGILGVAFAAERPARIRTLNLISTPMFINDNLKARAKFGHSSWEEAMRKLGVLGYAKAKNSADRFPPDADPGLMEWFAEEQGKSDVEVLIAMSRFATPHKSEPYLPLIKAPTLVIYPSHDTHTTPEHENLLREKVRDLELIHLQSHFHNLHSMQPRACAEKILHFAARHDGISCEEQ